MAVSPLGNVIVVNQMTPAATSMQNAHTNRVDIQNFAAQVAANEKKQEIEEIRPTEENHKIDPDREHQKGEADEELSEQTKQKQRTKTQKQSSQEQHTTHILDIKV